jgi:hypothetical protein
MKPPYRIAWCTTCRKESTHKRLPPPEPEPVEQDLQEWECTVCSTRSQQD